MSEIVAVFQVGCTPAEVEGIARDIVFEQTVEMPPDMIRDPYLLERYVGRVRQIEPMPKADDCFRVTVSYPAHLSGGQVPQLLNLLYGNVSMKRNLRLVNLLLPDDCLAAYPGPRHGVAGLRALCGVHGRPLLATALKPLGAPARELAEMAHAFALGGGDLVKDDHNLFSTSFAAFRERVELCQAAVTRANQVTGGRTLYLPNLMAPAEQLDEQLRCVLDLGVRGVLVSPFLLGLDVVRSIAKRYPLVLMAHPSFSGAFFHDPRHGATPGLILGTVFRLCGADVSVFPNRGGRFSFTEEDCAEIGVRVRSPLGHLRPAWPAPAGGMRYDTLTSMGDQYGRDAVFLVGSALAGYGPDLAANTRAFVARIESQFPREHASGETVPVFAPSATKTSTTSRSDSLRTPRDGAATPPDQSAAAASHTAAGGVSVCELPATGAAQQVLPLLRFRPDFSWEGRETQVYKTHGELPFRDVSRVELVGKAGEASSFDLRYFQIEPGGYSSFEQHAHTHTIVCIRGEGVLLSGGREHRLEALDVAYIAPLEAHQLRNEGPQPFGFFCIVDRHRDRPRAVSDTGNSG